MLTAVLFIHPVVDVSAQGRCTITPINPTTLTAAGGVLAIGTVNVMIQCNCTDDGAEVEPVTWYDPDGIRLPVNTHKDYIAHTPYYRRAPDDTNIVLVIPTFNDSYDGEYICGMRAPPGVPNTTINLAIGGELMIQLNVCICYLNSVLSCNGILILKDF